MLYPVSADYLSDSNWPGVFNLPRSVQTINENTRLIVLNWGSEEDLYAYVLWEGYACFVLKGAGLRLDDEAPPPAQYDLVPPNGLILYGPAEIFRYPTLVNNRGGMQSDFFIKTLPKNTPVTVISCVSHYYELRSGEPVYFYEILYTEGDLVYTGFIRQYHVTSNTPHNAPENLYGRIKADNIGMVAVYRGKDENEDPYLHIRDKTRVLLIGNDEDGWLWIQWTEKGELRQGYIKTEYFIFTGLTAMQIIGIIVLSLSVIVAALTFWLKTPRKKPPSVSEPIRL
jgi:hypothetical protein